MGFNFDLFAESDEGRPSTIEEVMELLQHQVDDHGLPMDEMVEILYDLFHPGKSKNSHDVRPMWCGAMWALGHGEVCDQFGALYLNTMPWGIGFHIGILPDFEFVALAPAAQRAVIASLVAVLRGGGIEAELTDSNQINILGPGGQQSSISIEDIIGQFKVEMNEELGPDGPEDEMGRWMP